MEVKAVWRNSFAKKGKNTAEFGEIRDMLSEIFI